MEVGDGKMEVNGNSVKTLAERDPANLPWADLNINFVVEATGIFATREACSKHLDAGGSKVLLTVPPKDEIDATIGDIYLVSNKNSSKQFTLC